MHWMSVDWFAVMFWGMSMDSVFLFDGCPRAWRQWQGASKKGPKKAQILGVISDPRASCEHRSGIGQATEVMDKMFRKQWENMKHCKIFEVWGQGQRAGGIQKRTNLVRILGVISDPPGIAQASRKHRSSIARASLRHPKFWKGGPLKRLNKLSL